MASRANEIVSIVSRHFWSGFGVVVLWVVTVVSGLRVANVTYDARTMTTAVLGPAAGSYLASCPLPLTTHFVTLLLLRHPIALLMGSRLRPSEASHPTGRVVAIKLTAAYVVWMLLAALGAFVVGLWPLAQSAAVSDRAVSWTREVALMSTLAGLPALAVAAMCALLARKSLSYWLLTTTFMLVFFFLAFAVHPRSAPPIFPGPPR